MAFAGRTFTRFRRQTQVTVASSSGRRPSIVLQEGQGMDGLPKKRGRSVLCRRLIGRLIASSVWKDKCLIVSLHDFETIPVMQFGPIACLPPFMLWPVQL
jgi:hypothetical protein